jgi:hypothetical protein
MTRDRYCRPAGPPAPTRSVRLADTERSTRRVPAFHGPGGAIAYPAGMLVDGMRIANRRVAEEPAELRPAAAV